MIAVETDDAIYEIEFGYAQIEITGRCNLRCRHCRASQQPKRDMSPEQISKLAAFAARHGKPGIELVISGGEPTIHGQFPLVLKRVRDAGIRRVSITTNGFLLDTERLRVIAEAEFEHVSVAVSLDSALAEEHNEIRRNPRSFSSANNALRTLLESGISGLSVAIRSTVKPGSVCGMESVVEHGMAMGVRNFAFSSVIPSGRATLDASLHMDKAGKRLFLETVNALQSRFPSAQIVTNDPLKCLVEKQTVVGRNDGEMVIGGCGAGIITFNVNCDGIMTPCAMLDVQIMDTTHLDLAAIEGAYSRSVVVGDLLGMNFHGCCGRCKLKKDCGGCRARALGHNGHLMAEDPHCWIND